MFPFLLHDSLNVNIPRMMWYLPNVRNFNEKEGVGDVPSGKYACL